MSDGNKQVVLAPKQIRCRTEPNGFSIINFGDQMGPTNRSYAFFGILKDPNFDTIGKSPFENWIFPICSKFGFFKQFKKALDPLVGVT